MIGRNLLVNPGVASLNYPYPKELIAEAAQKVE